ncbi:hypothetical protein IDH50_08485 [Aeromicrobium tamlense]|uniref:Uncharacterized protein n=1 Tax=Aeromicrobium tamlense TaxID=375541 RepID=A0A8I0KN06_9ACTN|nr:DUF6350 family protein [Aeromicrobium tamlense]MBD1270264.1 hypothetical protein [Aeromicrobium tamlense]NYI39078.1 hypothetical protein [Aeromicrobium tamlense]
MTESRAADQWRPAILTAVGSTVLSLLIAGSAASATTLAASTPDLLRASIRAWLVAVGATLTTGDERIDVVPLGATIVVVVLVLALTRLALRTPIVDPVAFGAMTGGVAGVLAGICSAATSTETTSTSFVRAAFGAFLVVGLPAAWGASRRSGIAWMGLPSRWIPVADGASSGVIGLLGGAAVVTFVMLTLHLDRAADLWATLDPDGPLLLGLMCLLALPTLVLWTTAVILGPGFTLGADTTVDLAGSALGQVPGFPPLAALPDPGPFDGWVVVLTLVPLAAGVAAGLVTYTRTTAEQRGWGRAAGDGALAGAVAGAIVGLLLETARGGLGPGLLQTAGSPAWQGLLVAVPLLAAGGALGAIGAHYRSARDRASS